MALSTASLHLPRWFTEFRSGQLEVAQEILDHFRADKRIVFLDAPTGAGKSLVAEVVRQFDRSGFSPRSSDGDCCYDPDHGWTAEGCCSEPEASDEFEQNGTRRHRAMFTCTTKTLQEQVERDFPYGRIIKGRVNFPTERFPSRYPELSCADCTGGKDTPCDWCSTACPYRKAKGAALSAPLAIGNTAYMLAEANGAEGFSGLDLLITDECDLLESQLLSYVEIYISERRRRQLGIPIPKRKTVAAAWQEWLNEYAIPIVFAAMGALPQSRDIRVIKERRRLKELYDKLMLVNLDDGWVYDGYHKDDPEKGDIRFRPIKVDRWGPSAYFRHAKRHLLMSATIISAEQMADDLGLGRDQWAYVEMPSTFPAARCPIHVRAVADVSKRGNEQHKLIPEILRIMDANPGERILVHTVSFALTRYLAEHLTSPRVMWYESSRDRETTLTRFRKTKGAVLLAPSLDRGISLDDDACRVVIVAKMAFPDLSDKQVSARLYSPGGNTWYAVQTIRSLAQAVGRGMRSETDWCESFILDSNFVTNVWQRSRHLIPSWFKARLSWHGRAVVDKS